MQRIDRFQETNDTRLSVSAGNTLTQSFTVSKNNFTGIRVVVYNPKLGGAGSYLFSISDDQNVTVKELTVSESNMGWGEQFRFDFAPIHDSAGKSYALSIVSQQKDLKDVLLITDMNTSKALNTGQKFTEEQIDLVEKNYIALAYGANDYYKDGTASLNSTPLPGDLVFQTYYRTSAPQFIRDSLISFAGRMSQDSGFLIFYLLTLSLLIACIVARVRRNAVTK